MIIRVFTDINMNMGIPGLNEVLRKAKYPDGAPQMFMFLNKKKTQCKIIWQGQFCLQFRKEDGQITVDELKKIPGYFKSKIMSAGAESAVSKVLPIAAAGRATA